jgi:hypothetical protein
VPQQLTLQRDQDGDAVRLAKLQDTEAHCAIANDQHKQ